MDSLYGPENGQPEHAASVFDYQDTPQNTSWAGTLPLKQALYDPELEKDACGVGFAAYFPPIALLPLPHPPPAIPVYSWPFLSIPSHSQPFPPIPSHYRPFLPHPFPSRMWC